MPPFLHALVASCNVFHCKTVDHCWPLIQNVIVLIYKSATNTHTTHTHSTTPLRHESLPARQWQECRERVCSPSNTPWPADSEVSTFVTEEIKGTHCHSLILISNKWWLKITLVDQDWNQHWSRQILENLSAFVHFLYNTTKKNLHSGSFSSPSDLIWPGNPITG